MIGCRLSAPTLGVALLWFAAPVSAQGGEPRLAGGLALVALIYSGEYNVAASKPHYPVVEWALATTMERSVRDHAAGIEVPPLSDSALLRTGFEHFEAMCVTCHGAPGVERSEIGKGLTPQPPELSPEEYRAIREAGGGGHGASGHPHGDGGAGSPGHEHSHGASGHPEGHGS